MPKLTHKPINRSGRTAIKRKKESVPARQLGALLSGTVLDFGCGYGADVDYYQSLGYWSDGYDPNHRPNYEQLLGEYDCVTCTYVANVLNASDRRKLYAAILAKLDRSGVVFITVRSDRFVDGFTSKSTYQEHVSLPFIPYLEKKNAYVIYKLNYQQLATLV